MQSKDPSPACAISAVSGSFHNLLGTDFIISRGVRCSLQSSAVNRDGRSGHVFSCVASEPHDQAGDGGGLHPLRHIGAGHGFTVGGRIHGAWQNHVGSDAGVFVFEDHGADQRYQRCLGRAVGTDGGAGGFGSATANGDDAPGSRFAHVWDGCSQHVEGPVEIHIEHALEGGVVGVGDSLASGKAADQVSEDVDLSEAGDNAVGCLLRSGEAIEHGGKRGEAWAFEVGLLDLRRETDHGETGVQQGFCDVRSEAAVGSGNEGSFFRHKRSFLKEIPSKAFVESHPYKGLQWQQSYLRQRQVSAFPLLGGEQHCGGPVRRLHLASVRRRTFRRNRLRNGTARRRLTSAPELLVGFRSAQPGVPEVPSPVRGTCRQRVFVRWWSRIASIPPDGRGGRRHMDYARFRCSVSLPSSFSQRATTSVATPLPIMLTRARNMLMKRSMPRMSAMPATGIVGITLRVPTSAMNEAPCTPLAPFEVRTATANSDICCRNVRWVFVACATNRAAMVMYRALPSVLKV